jgi:hypothetical protein
MTPVGTSRLRLEVSLRNRGAAAVAYPWLELSLGKGGDVDNPVLRKVIAPDEYLGAAGLADSAVRQRLHDGLAAGAEWHVRLDFALHEGRVGSYTVYLFYP